MLYDYGTMEILDHYESGVCPHTGGQHYDCDIVQRTPIPCIGKSFYMIVQLSIEVAQFFCEIESDWSTNFVTNGSIPIVQMSSPFSLHYWKLCGMGTCEVMFLLHCISTLWGFYYFTWQIPTSMAATFVIWYCTSVSYCRQHYIYTPHNYHSINMTYIISVNALFKIQCVLIFAQWFFCSEFLIISMLHTMCVAP